MICQFGVFLMLFLFAIKEQQATPLSRSISLFPCCCIGDSKQSHYCYAHNLKGVLQSLNFLTVFIGLLRQVKSAVYDGHWSSSFFNSWSTDKGLWLEFREERGFHQGFLYSQTAKDTYLEKKCVCDQEFYQLWLRYCGTAACLRRKSSLRYQYDLCHRWCLVRQSSFLSTYFF